MAEERNQRRKGGPNFINEGRWILLFLIIAAVILLQAKGGLFGKTGGIRVGSPSPAGTVDETPPSQPLPPPQALGPLQGTTAPSASDSSLKNKIALYQGNAARTDPAQEYIELSASYDNKDKILITGFTLENSKSEKVKIGSGASLPYAGQANFEEPIWLGAGERVFLISGESPIGANFRTNLCTGYFAEFKNFEPQLAQDCPRPEDESAAKGFEQSCANFLISVPRCRQPQGTPQDVSQECRDYVLSKVNYKTCADTRKNDKSFYRREWYVYFGRAKELWKDRGETITLRDAAGKIIATLSY